MPSNPDSSSARWPWAIRGLVVATVLAGLAIAFMHRKGGPRDVARGATRESVKATKAKRPVAITARTRATVGGRVVDPEGKAVTGATVCAFLRAERAVTTRELQAPRCEKTDRDGGFSLADLFPGTPLVVTASAAGFKPTSYRGADGNAVIRLGEGEQREGLDIALRGGGVEIKGSVSDATGGAVAGAVVTEDSEDEPSVTMSDEKGSFTLWVEPGQARIAATATGYAIGWAWGPAPGHFFKIDLVPGATLVGRTVTAGDATPVAGVMVNGIATEGSFGSTSARTDEEGRFRIEGLSPGRYRVEATSEGREGYSKSSVTLGLGETSAEVEIELDPAYVVKGQVVERGTQKPCAGGSVRLFDHSQSEFSEATIESDGTTRMASVIPGSYRVEVKCKDHVDRDDYPVVVVKDRDLAPQRWEVDRGAAVRVEVVDGQGKAVTKASVWAMAEEPQGSTVEANLAGADGAFLVAGLKPGKYRISAQREGNERAEQPVTAAADHDERVRIELPLSGTIVGVVEDEAHRPVADVPIMASGASYASATSLEDGTFTLNGLPSGEYVVRINRRRAFRDAVGGDEGSREAKVTLTAPDKARVTLTAPARSGFVSGKVIDGTGKPVTDAFIDCRPLDGGRYNAFGRSPVLTDTEGRFTAEDLAEGTYNVRAHRQGGTEATAEKVQTGTRDLVIKLADGGSISGVLTARGAPVERFDVSARSRNASFMRSESFFHAGGAFTLSDLPPGPYTLVADTPQGNATVDVTLAEGEQKSGISLSLTLRSSLDGRLVELESGAPIAGARLDVDGSSPFSVMNNDGHGNTSGSDGRFHLEGVLPGTWQLAVWPTDSEAIAPARVTVVVPEGGGGDAGTVRLVRSRLGPNEARGNVGVYLDSAGALSAFGPAAEAGLQSGDDILTVDGYDVKGQNQYLFFPLTTVPAGRTLTFGLASGRAVSVTAQ